jgi:23S rRNA-intervening sequence protein
MALHTELPIYKAAFNLLDTVTDLTAQFPRNFRASMGEQIRLECVRTLTAVARANIARDKSPHLEVLLESLHVIEILMRLSRDKRFISTAQYARTIECTSAIGRQAMGWKKAQRV